MKPTLRDMLELTAAKYPGTDAVCYPRRDQQVSYAELDQRVNKLANAFSALGIEKGDRVSTLLYNRSEIVRTLFACAKIGAVFHPLNYRYSSKHAEYVLEDAGSSLCIFEAATRELVADARGSVESVENWLYVDEDPPEYAGSFTDEFRAADDHEPNTVVEPTDIYALLYTSGTTGRPKGVVLEHGDIVDHTVAFVAEGGSERADVGLSTLPLYHAGELHGGLLPRVQVGATTVVHYDFDPVRVLEAIEDHRVTVFFAAPTGWNALLKSVDHVGADLSSLRLCIYAAAPMPTDILEECLAVFDAGFLQGYGMTEIGALGTLLHPEDQTEKPQTAGKPALYRDVRIVDPEGKPHDELTQGETGEIMFTSACMMREYWNEPDRTAQVLHELEGQVWYRTGDIGYLDDDGYLTVVDRKDDMIITGGENVYPRRIDDVLNAHPGVSQAAVVGEPHEKWGEQVVAYVVGDATVEELNRHVRESDTVADFERPRRYYFVNDLPMNPSGTVQKFRLRDGTADIDPTLEEP